MSLRELHQLHVLLERLGDRATVELLGSPEGFPIYGIELGSGDVTTPCLFLVGGVHGLERIGTQVVLAYLGMIAERLRWDETTHEALERARIVAIPLLNPVGMKNGQRSNGNGVDLMRNGPTHGRRAGAPLVGGHRISSMLPWFMGAEGELELESRALIDFAARRVLPADAAVSLDVHSGFGFVDRIWFPYARTPQPFPQIAELYALHELLNQTLPHHVYRTEPQSHAYSIDGDLWDHLYDLSRQGAGGVFLPMTLEMGSWNWVRKNPKQVFSALGTFNPIKGHRVRRTLRRHLLLLDFLHRAAVSHRAWSQLSESERTRSLSSAVNVWFT